MRRNVNFNDHHGSPHSIVTIMTFPNFDVESTMQYLTAESKYNRRYITPGCEINTGVYETKKVHVMDVRPRQEEHKLDVNGFQLFQHQSKVCYQLSVVTSRSLTLATKTKSTDSTSRKSKNSSNMLQGPTKSLHSALPYAKLLQSRTMTANLSLVMSMSIIQFDVRNNWDHCTSATNHFHIDASSF